MSVPLSQTSEVMRKRFGQWLKERREDAGMTQLDLAVILDYAYPTTVSQIERGKSKLPPAELIDLAKAIRVDPEQAAEQYLYYIEPFLYAAMRGKSPYASEDLPCPEPVIVRRAARTQAIACD